MKSIRIDFLKGLSFSARNAVNQRFFDTSISAKKGVLVSRRAHEPLLNIGESPTRLLFTADNGRIYSVSINGVWRSGSGTIDSGYSIVSDLIRLTPNIDSAASQIFIAGGAKMRKWNEGNQSLTKWGIDAPPSNPLILSLVSAGETSITTCENTTNWSSVSCTITQETGIKIQGAASIKIAISANTLATAAFDLPSPILNINPTFFDFYFRSDSVSSLTILKISVTYVLNGQLQTDEQNIIVTLANNVWQHIKVNQYGFIPIGANITRIFFTINAVANISIYIDDIVLSTVSQDDTEARYKYAYEDSNTGVHSNLNLTPSTIASGDRNIVTVSGFQQPPGGQGIDRIRLFRDFHGNGIYQSVKFVSLPAIWNPLLTITDDVSVSDLGDVDGNDNFPPPLADAAIEYLGSVWLNDMNNPVRAWRSIAGRIESFRDFFNASGVGDKVIDFAIIRGVLFVLTKEHISQVLNPDTTPFFLPIVDIGPATKFAYYTTRDFIIIGHFTGIYLFDGANLKRLENISALFNPLSNDPRRINDANIATLKVGSDGIHIWIGYQRIDGQTAQWTYDMETDTYTEDSIILTAHEKGDEIYGHIAGSSNGSIFSVYRSTVFNTFQYASEEIELDSTCHFLQLRIRFNGNTGCIARLFVNEALAQSFNLFAQTLTNWAEFVIGTASNLVIGDKFRIEIDGGAQGYVEIYNIELIVEELGQLVHYNSEDIHLTDEKVVFIEYGLNVLALESGLLTSTIYIDDQLAYTLFDSISRNHFYSTRKTLLPKIGRNVRLNISGAKFSPRAANLKTTVIGSGEIKSIDLFKG